MSFIAAPMFYEEKKYVLIPQFVRIFIFDSRSSWYLCFSTKF